MIVAKTTGVALALLLSFQVSSFADTTRVEDYHNSKHHNGPSRSDIDRSHRDIQNHRDKQYYNNRVASPHRKNIVQAPQHLRPSHYRRPSHHRIGHHVSHLRRNAYRFRYDGHRYRYSKGVFYRPYNHGFRIVQAPIGAIILSLPIGYTHMRISDRDYYRYNDIYYQRELAVRGYRVVQNPYMNQTSYYRVGDMVDTLPLGARAVIIDNVRYYEHDNYYFRPQRRNGLRMYLVVDF